MLQTSSSQINSLLEENAMLESRLREYQTRTLSAEAENKRLKSEIIETKSENKQLLVERFFGST